MTPGYWMHETSGVLRPAIIAYFHGCMNTQDVAAMRAYLRQWISAPVWHGDGIAELREGIDGLTSADAIRAWLNNAAICGIDPL
jgi:hypothetical protein